MKQTQTNKTLALAGIFQAAHFPILGKLNTLKQKDSIDKIFAVLIAGIRSAVLWYQMGGNRWQLFLFRKQLRDHATLLLTHEYSR